MSGAQTRPRVSSSTISLERLTPILQPAIDGLASCRRNPPASIEEASGATEHILLIRHTLIDDHQPQEAKSLFRQLKGFENVLGLLAYLADLYNPDTTGDADGKLLLSIVKDSLGIVAESLKDDPGNKRYFGKRDNGGGIVAYERILSGLAVKLSSTQDAELFYGGLLAAGLGQETMSQFFTTVRKKAEDSGSNNLLSLSELVNRTLGNGEVVENPEFFGALLRLWLAQTVEQETYPILRLSVPLCLTRLASLSQRNCLALHSTGILSPLLTLVTVPERSKDELEAYLKLATILCQHGVNSLQDAIQLYQKAQKVPQVSRFLLDALKSSKSPPCVHFDLSSHGYSSIELPTLGRPFPSITSSGYTLTIWARVDKFEPDTHTTLFGAYDASQTCFVLVYLEKDTHNLILQTSIKGIRPSVRFKATKFLPGQWYHICIVHKRPKTLSLSRALLFVNGEFAEQLKADYPVVPKARPNQKHPQIQAFLGTPRDLAVRVGKGISSSKWSLASAILFDEAFNDDLIAVLCHLGPRYYGNFQDCLGSFQTYRASATLNLRNENLHAGKEDQSDIVSVIRQKGSILIPENSVLLNISPTSVMDDDDTNNIDESQLVKSLSKSAGKSLTQLTKVKGNSVVINGAVPAINDALTQPHGVAILTGDPVVIVPQSLDDVSWRIGGCAGVHLSLVEAATARESLRLALELLFEAVQDNWRNSEAMEKENGYGILAMLLREKLGFASPVQSSPLKTSTVCNTTQERNEASMELLIPILRFVGYDFENPKKSLIINPLAYRILLIDLDIWRQADLPLLEIYYSQFRTFCLESQYHRFNSKRLSRMRVIKRLIEALKAEIFTAATLKLFVAAFKSLVGACMTAEVLRSVSLFITFSIHSAKQRVNQANKNKTTRLDIRSRRPGNLHTDHVPGYISKEQIGVEILRVFTEVFCNSEDTVSIQKFARTVTNKWLLYLLSEDNPDVVILVTMILSRLFIVHGTAYTKKFAEKTGGFVVMRHRLKRWWNLAPLWPLCFSILFGLDPGLINLDRNSGPSDLQRLLSSPETLKVSFPEVLPVITGMLQLGLKATVMPRGSSPSIHPEDDDSVYVVRPRADSGSSSLRSEATTAGPVSSDQDILKAVVDFLARIHEKSQNFRDFTVTSNYVEELLRALYPVVVGSDIVNAGFELESNSEGLRFGGDMVTIQPLQGARPIVRTSTVEGTDTQGNERELHRSSSFILVSSNKSKYSPSPARLQQIVTPVHDAASPHPTNPVANDILDILLAVYTDQLFGRKEFPGLLLFARIPPGFVEHQIFFESWILKNLLAHLEAKISKHKKILIEPRVLNNLSRLLSYVADAVYGGWFIDGAIATLNFIGPVLEYLQEPDIASLKSVRLCSQTIAGIRSTVFRTVLLRLSAAEGQNAYSFLQQLTYWQTVLLSHEESPNEQLQLIYYLLYSKIVTEKEDVRVAAAGLWRITLVQKPSETSAILGQATPSLHRRLSLGFQKLVGMDDDSFLHWIDDQRDDLDCFFFGALCKGWESFVRDENTKTQETARIRASKRKDKLRQWTQIESVNEEILRKHGITFGHWTANISVSEGLKHQRAVQDQQDDFNFMASAFSRMFTNLRRENGFLATQTKNNWRLDQTEGRSRMRLRVTPDDSTGKRDYQPKRKVANDTPEIKLDVRTRTASNSDIITLSPSTIVPDSVDTESLDNEAEDKSATEDSFELIDEPTGNDPYEDKNRKVMKNLQRGDQVQYVCNISRIIGLEACEGLLILGKISLYIMDNFFQRADCEIVHVSQAHPEERDPYVRVISGRESDDRKHNNGAHRSRSWIWADVVSVSKRQFLFRDVALEIFFSDGRSYLLTLISAKLRNELYNELTSRAPQTQGNSSSTEDSWRFETLRSEGNNSQFFGSKLVNVFSQMPSHPATRKWLKGEMSNFHYLMLVNTLAGRTFNDLTQYPVFPWVLADYTSEELDLTNPRTFRDLSKPMGCQTITREADFRSRYQSFAEMGDENAPPFHYGTHYSSAMIVCSYLIRLQPFVKSYLLLQGGTFDHADRLFFSIPDAWNSASRLNMTDVRELIPEFFYLPEFLSNSNNYDFGIRQSTGQSIDSVELPPWAKGDPKIFIAKHREALESPFVTRNLHQWIDLIFGTKQRGEAALEAVNVFHHLSYRGAKDLDSIEDPMERLATIGIIHNFGQTPHQVFHKHHPGREEIQNKPIRLDSSADSLTRLPFTLLDIQERVSSLSFSVKQDRLLCAAAFRLNIPPAYDRYMEWGFSDGSVRFYAAESRKLIGHFEHVHIGQLSSAIFADSQTLITAGTDCTIAVWSFTSTSRSVDLLPKASLFGHRSPVTVLAVSRSFSTILSASKDGQVMLWDLNRLEFLRELSTGPPVSCARINDVTGNIAVCRGNMVCLFTLNGTLLLERPVCEQSDDNVLSCAFYEGAGNEWLERELFFTGHRKGLVNIWSKCIRNGVFELDLIRQLHHVNTSRGDGAAALAGITCVLPLSHVVYTGDESGQVYEWNCVQRH
ncbi:WD repeat and FYVE domain-containing protein 3 [Nannizzia gypsea CBS 118893]|uniref:WD repeat and FYVE domain-containing protein 3 n=1 Tax=Arthroderma gypseum (strain ATCC MYA-4604 / CBS 118893) TaxID=535722 RepID=E4UUM9_ARTGP|nr:WD repeat and FYVE domain-containing protein 3 [Nannizzia gypsea CBS 118893]EFR00996.1 WD repeat and FYVE domain-containing protein 3 [Nannizzia gypsea CBS 118893]